ncbi:uncharacterized protein LOC131328749 [Rhododendron vialii]|uniref:uncharacterized protein LOC131328749 n=1 Tax=Rhododendron vialii TaxID=182163 RepID=UPI00265EC7E9|nr:uncharacterized protein LOC131328749 [Rhododendron vialii]
MGDLRCTLNTCVGGKVVRGSQSKYLNGVIAEIKVDPDSFTFYELMVNIRQMGYGITDFNGVTEYITVFYRLPMHDTNNGLVELTSHDDMLQMFAVHSGRKYIIIDVYVHCPNVVESDEDCEDQVEVICRETNTTVDPSSVTELGGDLDVGGHVVEHLHGDGVEHIVQESCDEEEVQHIVREGVDAEEMDEGSDSDCEWQPNDDSESSCGSFSGIEESSDEEQEETIPLVGLGNTYNLGSKGDEDLSSDNDDNNLGEDYDEDGKPIFLEFKESYMKNPQLIEGMKFPNVRVFRKLLREYHIKEGYTFTFLKNESTRVTVKCARDCGFRLHASPMYDEKSFQIKKITQMHKCTRIYTNNNATSSWLSQKYITKLVDAPETKVKSMKNIVRREWLINVSHTKVYRAKRKALELIQGDHRKQYLRLWDYCEMIRIQNPNSVTKLNVEKPLPGEGPVFQRMFIGYDAHVKGFLAGCRPIIGLDACFLKGPFGGQLMHATAKDANNQMFPLAFAVVEAETKDSWTWFMENLTDMIGNPEQKGWCFISDRQKGLTETFAQKYPNVEHRYCIRHMYSNFNKLYKGKEWKDLMWGAASVYTVQEFEERMNEIKEIDETAYEWLMREEPTTWARCMYSTRSKCNRMDNNTSEAFNTAIKDARDQPILTMVESIRRYLMTRLQTRLKLCMGWNGNICPRISRRIERTQQLMGESEVMYSGGTIFEVICVPRIYVVDIGQKTCTCKKWDVSGIPCAHGMAAIITDKSDPEDYVDQCFHQSTFARTYSFTIKPIPDQTMWVRTDFDPISPPPFRAKSGRPKKNRRKGPDEPKTTSSGVRKYYTTLKCGQCKQPGHNARTCPHKSTNSTGEQVWSLCFFFCQDYINNL